MCEGGRKERKLVKLVVGSVQEKKFGMREERELKGKVKSGREKKRKRQEVWAAKYCYIVSGVLFRSF
jgi:hypothetical protein